MCVRDKVVSEGLHGRRKSKDKVEEYIEYRAEFLLLSHYEIKMGALLQYREHQAQVFPIKNDPNTPAGHPQTQNTKTSSQPNSQKRWGCHSSKHLPSAHVSEPFCFTGSSEEIPFSLENPTVLFTPCCFTLTD